MISDKVLRLRNALNFDISLATLEYLSVDNEKDLERMYGHGLEGSRLFLNFCPLWVLPLFSNHPSEHIQKVIQGRLKKG